MSDISNNILKPLIALLLIFIMAAMAGPAAAEKPAHTGVPYPPSAGTGTVTGRAVNSTNSSAGIGGVYVAIVNASDVSQEYANATSDLNGNFSFTGVSAASNISYKIYMNKSPYQDNYSAAFVADANNTTTILMAMQNSTPTPTATPAATATPAPASASTSTPTPAPAAVNNSTDLDQMATPTVEAPTPTPAATATPGAATPKAMPAVPIWVAVLMLGLVALCARKSR